MNYKELKELVISNSFMIEELTDTMRTLYITCSPSYFSADENSNVFAIVEFKNIEDKIDNISLFNDLVINEDGLIFTLNARNIDCTDITKTKINNILKNIKKSIDFNALVYKRIKIKKRKNDLEQDFE